VRENFEKRLCRRQCRQHSLLAIFEGELSRWLGHRHSCHCLLVDVGPTSVCVNGHSCRRRALAVAMASVPMVAAVPTATRPGLTPCADGRHRHSLCRRPLGLC
jgi:hypothetical protein